MLLLGAATNCLAAENGDMGHMDHQHMHHLMLDSRTSLNLSPELKQHQLANMRSHVEAVQAIVGLLSTGEFDKASQVAHSKLGLTEEMKKMCGMFGNEKFNQLGLAFHKSGDTLGEALQSKDLNKSLSALHDTMEYCVQCHATFRQ
jgi:hypothetical protein